MNILLTQVKIPSLEGNLLVPYKPNRVPSFKFLKCATRAMRNSIAAVRIMHPSVQRSVSASTGCFLPLGLLSE